MSKIFMLARQDLTVFGKEENVFYIGDHLFCESAFIYVVQ